MQKRVEPEIPRDLRSLIIPLWEQGYTYGQIAKKLGLGDRRGIVSGHVSRHKRGAQSLPVWPKHQFRCGHEKTDDNTTDGNGCRICNNARQRRLYARQKEGRKLLQTSETLIGFQVSVLTAIASLARAVEDISDAMGLPRKEQASATILDFPRKPRADEVQS